MLNISNSSLHFGIQSPLLLSGNSSQRAFGWLADYDGCGYYRVRLPLAALQADLGASEFYWDTEVSRIAPHNWFEYNVLIGQRVCQADDEDGPAVRWAKMCNDFDTLTVYEIDDDLFNLDPSNPAHEFFADPAIQNNIRGCAQRSDIVTVSTEPLADVMRKHNPNVVVLPNYVDSALLTILRPEPKDFTVIGWSGSATHDADFDFMGNGLRRVMERNPQVRFMTIGGAYGKDLPRGRVRRMPWVKSVPRLFPRIAEFDIGIAPLKPSAFNNSKSYIKALEYAALGIPCVASDVGPYPEFIEHGVTGFLVKQDHEWEKYLSLLVNDPELRQTMGQAARKKAANFTIQGNIDKWAKTYVG